MPLEMRTIRTKPLKFMGNFIRTTKEFVAVDTETGQRYNIADEMADPNVKAIFPISTEAVKGVRITLSAGGDRLYSIQPEQGTFFAVFYHLGTKPNEIPQSFMTEGGKSTRKDGHTFNRMPQLLFAAQMKIIGDTPFAGVAVPVYFPYGFNPKPDATCTYDAKDKEKLRFMEFLMANGTNPNEINIPYSANVLPVLENILQANTKACIITMENGYVTSFRSPGVGEEIPTIPAPSAIEAALDSMSEDDFKRILMGG